MAKLLDACASRIERAALLDKPGELLASAVRRATDGRPAADVATGTVLGHPMHPLLVAVPIGSWTAATALDLTGGDARAARRLVALGLAAAVPTIVTGLQDFSTTTQAERRVGLVHAASNSAAFGAYTMSYLARRRGRRARGALLSMLGSTFLGAGGWLGGHLAYGMGVGVDTTVFQHLSRDWTDAAAVSDVPQHGAICVDVGGVAVLLTRDGMDRIVALDDRCTHRGGALHEGEIAGGCVTCPLHGSQFELSDGAVVRGPATRPQPTFEVRLAEGRVQLRREDVRSLRTVPVGA